MIITDTEIVRYMWSIIRDYIIHIGVLEDGWLGIIWNYKSVERRVRRLRIGWKEYVEVGTDMQLNLRFSRR
jgi:hypothetical protein